MKFTADDTWHGWLKAWPQWGPGDRPAHRRKPAVMHGSAVLDCALPTPAATDERGRVDDARVENFTLSKGSERILLSLKTLLPVSMRAVCAPAKSRLFVVSSSEFLTNPIAYAGNGPELGPPRGDPDLPMFAGPYTKYLTSTVLSFKNTLDWMTGDEDLVDTALLGGHRGREPRGRAVAAKSKASAPLLADSHATANDPRPPPNGIFRPGEADRAATKGSPAALTLGSDGAEPRVLLDSAAKPGIKGSGSVDLATQNDPRVGAVPIRFALSLEAQ